MATMPRWQKYRLKDLEAYRKRKREYARTAEQREKRAAYMRKWRDENREKFNEQARLSHQKNKHKHVEKVKDRHLGRKYGMTLTEKVALIEKQEGKCAICQSAFKSERGTHVDHCHVTNKIRGILCHVCNTKLGWLEKYSKAINGYLER